MVQLAFCRFESVRHHLSHLINYPPRMMNGTLMFPLVSAGLVVVGITLLLAGPWPVGLPVLVAGTGELVGRLWRWS